MLPAMMTLVFAFMFIGNPTTMNAMFMFASIALQAAWNILESHADRQQAALRIHAAIASAASGGVIYSFITLIDKKPL